MGRTIRADLANFNCSVRNLLTGVLQDVVTSKLHDQNWRKLMEKSIARKQSERWTADQVGELFHSIDKDKSGEITKNVFSNFIEN